MTNMSKKENKGRKKQRARSLRAEAEKKLTRRPAAPPKLKKKASEKLVHELQVHQVELEMQNEELRNAQLALEETRDRYMDLYDFAPVGYFTFTREALIKEVNLTGASLLGIERQKLINRKFRRFVAPDDLSKWDRHLLSVFEQGERQSCELALSRADDVLFHARLDSIRMVAAGGAFVVRTAMSDITPQKKLEEQLRHAQKMETVGILVGNIAHEFNNILTAIIGYGYITLMKMPNDNVLRLNIEHMLESADRAARLTRRLLAFGRKQPILRKPSDLNEIIRKTEKFLVSVIGEEVICKTTLHHEELPILGDSSLFEQMLMNFATNARDAMPKGGLFTIATEQIRMDEQFIKSHGFGKTGLYGLITLSDTGFGMDEATQLRIFDPFFTTKEVGKGTGLGLAIVYGIIKQHDGYITVYSEPGKGSTFRIYIPVIAPGPREEIKTPARELPRGGAETILLAEDDEPTRKLSKTALEEFGYTVITAVDGKDAVNKFIENRDRIQLLVLDLIMPKMTGKEAYDKIKKIKPDMRAIVVSGYSPDIVRQRAQIEKETSLIFKPFLPVHLLKIVREELDKKGQRRTVG